MSKKDSKKSRKIAIIAGSRGEYGYYRPIVKEIEKRANLDYGFIVTNMHMLESFGSSIREINEDKLKVHASVYNTLDGYNRVTMVKSLSIFLMSLPELLSQMQADMLLIAGDRGEQLMAAITGAHMYLPVAHIQAGELSGNIDGMSRHAITKFAHIHFAANKDAADRLEKMGEAKFRIFNVGAPMLDELVAGKITPKEGIYKKFNLDPQKPIIIMVQHSVTEDLKNTDIHIMETIKALENLNHQTVVILNNSDAGSSTVRQVILSNKKPFMKKIVPNMKREDYAGLLSIADVIVGNSSSGILEAPTFKLPAVNIGYRQKGRVQGINVINSGYSSREIEAACRKALSPAFKKLMKKCVNPYGKGDSAGKIVDVLENISVDEKLLVKHLTY